MLHLYLNNILRYTAYISYIEFFLGYVYIYIYIYINTYLNSPIIIHFRTNNKMTLLFKNIIDNFFL